MEAAPEFLKVAMQAQVSLIVISTIAMLIGIATAQKTPRIPRNIYILWLCLACVLILPSFFLLKPLVFPELEPLGPQSGRGGAVPDDAPDGLCVRADSDFDGPLYRLPQSRRWKRGPHCLSGGDPGLRLNLDIAAAGQANRTRSG